MTFEEWANYGWQQGWCGPPVCYTHDGLPMADNEHDQLDEGDDPCIHVIRLYEQADTAPHGQAPNDKSSPDSTTSCSERATVVSVRL